MTVVVMILLAAAVAAWVLAPLRNATAPADPRARSGARDETPPETGGGAPGATIGRTPGGER